ncbi:geranylgeranylglycerol-phosphate geranylgeranyltransferase [Flavobacterium sp.]|uniref:geranylgeranylglycerol-phosphate geranylgeranyltransferase n=1 Tax=Flavobacterium sp. TaxID=239 RepID=UPI003528394B
MNYLKLIRIQNLAILAFMQILFRYTFLKTATYTPLTADQNFLAMTHVQFFLLVLATVLIAAAGYIINDIMDQETDELANKRIIGKSISEKTAYNLYFGLNVLGVVIGFYVANAVGKPSFSALFIIVAALLYVYATTLKQIAIIGNIVVACLLSFSVIILGIFDLLPTTYEDNQALMQHVFSILIDYAIFVFIINLLREMVKDIEDADADAKTGIGTLPVLIGKDKTMKIVFFLSFLPIALLAYYLKENLFQYTYVVYYVLLFIIMPLIFFTIKSWNAKTQKDVKNLSLLLKFILFFGILSIWVITYSVTNA